MLCNLLTIFLQRNHETNKFISSLTIPFLTFISLTDSCRGQFVIWIFLQSLHWRHRYIARLISTSIKNHIHLLKLRCMFVSGMRIKTRHGEAYKCVFALVIMQEKSEEFCDGETNGNYFCTGNRLAWNMFPLISHAELFFPAVMSSECYSHL